MPIYEVTGAIRGRVDFHQTRFFHGYAYDYQAIAAYKRRISIVEDVSIDDIIITGCGKIYPSLWA